MPENAARNFSQKASADTIEALEYRKQAPRNPQRSWNNPM